MARLIDSFWDNRNTGLRTCEIIFEAGDDFTKYTNTFAEEKYDYCTIKIPVGNLQLTHRMENHGYRYIENQLNISFKVDQLDSVEKSWNRDLSNFSYLPVKDNQQLDLILKEVSSGMFENDRFSLDPFWGRDVSSLRYVNWISQMYSQGDSQFYLLAKNSIEVGFFSMKNLGPKKCSCPIAGIYNDHKSKGYFFMLALAWFRESRERGCKELITSISTNNKPIHSFLARYFSFKIDETWIVMRKVFK